MHGSLPRSAPKRFHSLWMSLAAILFGCVLAGIAPGTFAFASDRPIEIALSAGARSFEDRLDLRSEAAFGVRVGTGLTRHVRLRTEFVEAAPTRKSTGARAHVSGLRELVEYGPWTGSIRPYAMGGVGGILFNFSDSYDTAAAAFAVGGGIAFDVASRVSLFGEASSDFYRYRTVTYSVTGAELSSSSRATNSSPTFLAGVATRF